MPAKKLCICVVCICAKPVVVSLYMTKVVQACHTMERFMQKKLCEQLWQMLCCICLPSPAYNV